MADPGRQNGAARPRRAKAAPKPAPRPAVKLAVVERPTAVVGVAASAANVRSLETLFASLQGVKSAAYVVCLQQANSLNTFRLAETLSQQSGLPAEIATDGVRLEPNRIYIAPSEQLMVMDDGHLSLTDSHQPPGERGSIDSFLVALSKSQHERAVAVILRGMGSDGIAGIAAFKEHGGLAIAESNGGEDQDHAIDPRGLVDFALPAAQIAERIAAYVGHLAEHAGPAAELTDETAQHLTRVASILRNKTGHDFHGYKHNTFLRRIRRRMQVQQIDEIDRYIEFLRTDGEEVGHLFQDLLIGVTQFFRDGPEFGLLEREVVPKLFEGKGAGDQLRVWVLGCATGEEAYSIGMLLREHMATLESSPHVQIFATDIDGRALASARSGRYPESIAKDVSPERLARWFSKEGATYCVAKELREMCIFSQHNVIKDAPFSHIDLVSCRNLLIYLTSELQDRVIPLFHFSLTPGGYLFLGPSENVTRHAKLFAPVDRRHRMFRRLETVTRVLPEFPLTPGHRVRGLSEPLARGVRARVAPALSRRAEQIIEGHSPAYVLVDEQYDVLHFSGRTGRYLEPSAGAANLNLLNLIHRDLRLDVRAALHSAAAERSTVKVDRLQIGTDGSARRVDLVVEPITGPDTPTSFVVLLQDGGSLEPAEEAEPSSSLMRDEQVQRLEAELRFSRERLQATIEELESTNEELKSSNEEYQSINEELQSANEELETSKEELQSVNEELQTVNGELAHRVNELGRANSDLKNLLESTQIATIFLDNDLRIKSFTPSIADVFHLLDTDIGRPIAHIASRVTYGELESDVRRVLRTLGTVEREVGDAAGAARYLVRVLPYRSIDNFIAGTVLTFLDVTATVKAEAEAAAANSKVQEILESIGDGFFAIDQDLTFTYVNQRALELWNRRADQLVGRKLRQRFPAAEFADLYDALETTRVTRSPVELEFLWPGLDRWMAVSVYPSAMGWSVFMRDIGERRRAETRQRLLMGELQHRVKNILAVVRSITSRTVESSRDLSDFSAHFDGRIGALARTQAVLARHAGQEVDLEQMVREELLSHAAGEQGVEVSGPVVQLRQKAAETFGLVLHELATNAVKYGALSSPAGKVSVSWQASDRPGGSTLSFRWVESGVAGMDTNPKRRGFGRDLIERGLPYDLPGAETSLSFAADGARCTIELPLNQYVGSALGGDGTSP